MSKSVTETYLKAASANHKALIDNKNKEMKNTYPAFFKRCTVAKDSALKAPPSVSTGGTGGTGGTGWTGGTGGKGEKMTSTTTHKGKYVAVMAILMTGMATMGPGPCLFLLCLLVSVGLGQAGSTTGAPSPGPTQAPAPSPRDAGAISSAHSSKVMLLSTSIPLLLLGWVFTKTM